MMKIYYYQNLHLEKFLIWIMILSQVIETKVYKRRWLILIIFVLYSASNSMQWIQYSIIANIVTIYYNVSTFSVDMTSMIYMITYIPFIFPASYLLDRFVSMVVKFIIKFIWLLFIFSCLQKWFFLSVLQLIFPYPLKLINFIESIYLLLKNVTLWIDTI